MIEKLKNVDVSKTCSEQTILFQLISGLHTSINMHVAMNFIDALRNETNPNFPLFLKTIGYFPDRIKNLYFLYSLVLKAVHKAENDLIFGQYSNLTTGEENEKPPVKELIKKMLTLSKYSCEEPFNEDYFF